jgi:2-C-methyl-D-erythritol 4-phosphate cytidylyltransferase
MNTAIIVAAGSGTRFAGDQPKQFVDLCGKPVIVHTLERFDACSDVDSIVVVVPPDLLDEFLGELSKRTFSKPIAVAAGGQTRNESVMRGLQHSDPETDIVAVHDGVRPLVDPEEISLTIRRAQEEGAACLVAPVTDTIKSIDGNHISGTLDRRDLRRALTPQAFRYSILKDALEKADDRDSATDECYLVEKSGVRIATVPGSTRNIKITHAEDLLFAEAVLRKSGSA